MTAYDDPWWESCDEEGNPEYSAYGPKEEPDCPPCGDTGRRDTRFGRRPCPDCSPTRLDVQLATARWRWREMKSRLRRAALRLLGRPTSRSVSSFDDQPPF